jgi:hypothetical protein
LYTDTELKTMHAEVSVEAAVSFIIVGSAHGGRGMDPAPSRTGYATRARAESPHSAWHPLMKRSEFSSGAFERRAVF